jgi:hypothetical protein
MATPTYTLIDSVTLASSAASVTFSSIPQSYADLVVVVAAKAFDSDEYTYMWINGDTTTSNYTYVRMFGSNAGYSTAASNPYAGQVIQAESCLNVMQIMDYSATNKHKTTLGHWDLVTKQTQRAAVRWANTSAITSLELDHGAGAKQYASGSTFYLYGIEA